MIITPANKHTGGRNDGMCRWQAAEVETAEVGLFLWAIAPWLFGAGVLGGLARLEADARSARAGCGADPSPVLPWEWRAVTSGLSG
jgi:hypothetical protein